MRHAEHRALLAAVLSVMLIAPAWAGFDEGLAAYNRGDYGTALKEWRPLAERGHVVAQYNLGLIYVDGLGVPKNDVEAVKWFRKAAEEGYAEAQFNLGTMYINEQGVPQDYAVAVKLLRKAAEQGYVNAQINLGIMYYQGQGVPQDAVQALMWLYLAAAQGNEIARENSNIMAGEMRPTDVSEAKKLAREWLEKHGQ